MSFSFSGLAATVTISGAVATSAFIPQPSSSQTPVTVKSQAGQNGTKTLYTVTAGKTFYLMGINVYASGALTQCALADNAGTLILWAVPPLASWGSFNLNGTCPIAVFTAGQAVKWIDSAANNFITLWGYEA